MIWVGDVICKRDFHEYVLTLCCSGAGSDLSMFLSNMYQDLLVLRVAHTDSIAWDSYLKATVCVKDTSPKAIKELLP